MRGEAPKQCNAQFSAKPVDLCAHHSIRLVVSLDVDFLMHFPQFGLRVVFLEDKIVISGLEYAVLFKKGLIDLFQCLFLGKDLAALGLKAIVVIISGWDKGGGEETRVNITYSVILASEASLLSAWFDIRDITCHIVNTGTAGM